MPPSVQNGQLNWPSPKPASRAASRGPTANTTCRGSFRCAKGGSNRYGLSARGRAQADAQGRCDGLAPEESADYNPPAHDSSGASPRSEEHTSELQSHLNLVCRLLLEKKKKKKSQSQETRETGR